jgi:hypothetical protein
MSKKLYAAFVPLLAVAAFAVMPAMAQAAEPHWYSNGTLIGSTKVAVSTHSTPAGLSLTALGNTITCTVEDDGYIWNPTGGGAGLDEIASFTNSACGPVTPTCAAGETLSLIALNSTNGQPVGVTPWPTHLAAGSRDVIEDIEIVIECNGKVKDAFHGTLSIRIHNGVAGSLAACTATPTDTYGEFDTASGELEDNAIPKNKATADGKDCIWGPSGDEVITIKSP